MPLADGLRESWNLEAASQSQAEFIYEKNKSSPEKICCAKPPGSFLNIINKYI